MNEKLLFSLCVGGSYLHSFVTSVLIMGSKEKLIHTFIHIPYGFVGGIIAKHNINYGFIYFTLITVYQVLEEVGNLVMYGNDKSWNDIEGYIIGFCYYVIYSILKTKQRDEVNIPLAQLN